MTPKYPRYQDYVINDGRLVGEFEEMYADFDDPWHQTERERWATDKAALVALANRLRHTFGTTRLLEIGCGLGHFTARLQDQGFDCVGIDVSETAIEKARGTHPDPEFRVGGIEDHDLIAEIRPDAIVMCEVTWYVLNRLREFLDFLHTELPDTFLLHAVVTYADGLQKYGTEYFSNLDGILRFFDMTYLESGEVRLPNGNVRTFFAGTWLPARLDAWTS